MRTHTHSGGRAQRPGPRPRLGIAGRATAGIAVAWLAVTLAACGNAAHGPAAQPSAPASYGGIPTWLPTPKVPVGRIVRASPSHPWLAIEGDTVSVQLAHGQVLATAVGPAVPAEGQFPLPKTTPCRFTVTFTRASGVVPLRRAAFTIVDEFGKLHHPRVRTRGGKPLPKAIAPGHTLILTITDRLPTGNGQLRWTPGTAKPVVSWDFDVEID